MSWIAMSDKESTSINCDSISTIVRHVIVSRSRITIRHNSRTPLEILLCFPDLSYTVETYEVLDRYICIRTNNSRNSTLLSYDDESVAKQDLTLLLAACDGAGTVEPTRFRDFISNI